MSAYDDNTLPRKQALSGVYDSALHLRSVRTFSTVDCGSKRALQDIDMCPLLSHSDCYRLIESDDMKP